ncbi:MAG: tRNA (adenine-N1)-methyltransferase [Bifidobacteriaceae bacterium]|nr:tRNA (adenine-N1)-methyltransferase [Bifidobacteriaceae bacterium]
MSEANQRGQTQDNPSGHRSGPLRAGERVQLTDPKGRHSTITLTPGQKHHTSRGSFDHDQVIGQPEACVVVTTGGMGYLVLRPLVSDYVLGMERGAAVIYPKDAALICHMADIFPGARVIEAGAGSGGLTLSLLRAVGPAGRVLSVELRPEFAAIARANVEAFFGGPPATWRLRVGDVRDEIARLTGGLDDAGTAGIADRIVLDMLAPWDVVEAAAAALVPGGVLICYVATTTQLSRTAEALRGSEKFTEPEASEALLRTWHLQGLAVRPDHRMVGHTGFLIQARRMAPGFKPPRRVRRPAPGAYGPADEQGHVPPVFGDETWTADDLGLREKPVKRARRIARQLGVSPDTPLA